MQRYREGSADGGHLRGAAVTMRGAQRRTGRTTTTTTTKLAVWVVAATTATAACSGGHRATAARHLPTPSTTAATSTVVSTRRYPFSGLPVPGGQAVRPALEVKIDNEAGARPQAGLDLADVVYEEIIEGGDTRFLAVFQSTVPPSVGPVRSVRPTDPLIVWPIGGLFAYSGGTAKFIGLLHQAPVQDVGAGAAGFAYARRPDRPSYHSLFASPARLWASLAPPPAPTTSRLFHFRPAGSAVANPGAAPVSHLDLVVGSDRVGYDWDVASRTWKRSEEGTPHVADDGAQIAPTTVIVQFVSYVASPGDFDPAHAPVFVAQLVGSGDAWFLSSGTLVRGRWWKPTPSAVISYTDAAGNPIAVLPGRTWVELAQTGAAAQVR